MDHAVQIRGAVHPTTLPNLTNPTKVMTSGSTTTNSFRISAFAWYWRMVRIPVMSPKSCYTRFSEVAFRYGTEPPMFGICSIKNRFYTSMWQSQSRSVSWSNACGTWKTITLPTTNSFNMPYWPTTTRRSESWNDSSRWMTPLEKDGWSMRLESWWALKMTNINNWHWMPPRWAK